MREPTVKKSVFLLAVVGLGACGVLPGDSTQEVRGVGVLVDADHMPGDPLVVPDTVGAGVTFQATVTTYGPSSCWKADGATVDVAGLTAEIVPYDVTTVGGGCTAVTVYPTRQVGITFGQTGIGTVRVKGRQMGTDVGTQPTVLIEKQVVVR